MAQNGAFTLQGFESPEEAQARIDKDKQGAFTPQGDFNQMLYQSAAGGASRIGGGIAKALGYEDPAVSRAKSRQELMQNTDFTSRESVKEAMEGAGDDTELKVELLDVWKSLEPSKTDIGISNVDPKDVTPESLQKYSQTGDYGDLKWNAAKKGAESMSPYVLINKENPDSRIPIFLDKNGGARLMATGEPVPAEFFKTHRLSKVPGMKRGPLSETHVNLPRQQPFLAAVLKGSGKQFMKDKVEAEGSRESIMGMIEAERMLDSGIISGFGADFISGTGKLLMQIGLIDETGDIAQTIQNTESYYAKMGKSVAEEIKAFGSGTGLSDADRNYAERIAGGDISMTEGSLRNILALNALAHRRKMMRYNEKAKKVDEKYGDNLPYLQVIQIPDIPYLNQGIPEETIDAYMKKYPNRTRFELVNAIKRNQGVK